MRTNIILWLLLSCAISSFAQNRVVLKPSGEIIFASETTTSLDIKSEIKDKKRTNTKYPVSSLPVKGVGFEADTMTYFPNHNANTSFGIFGQDWVLQWFQAYTDMVIRGAAISISGLAATSVQLEVKLVKLNWSYSEVKNIGTKHLGFYQADNNGYNNITAFLDNPDRTGNWVDSSGLGLTNPFAEDIWSDIGRGAIIQPILKTAEQNYQWINMNTLGIEPTILRGQIVGVAVRNLNPLMDSGRVGISSATGVGIPGFKFHSNGKNLPGIDYGWWSHDYTFDFALAVEVSDDCMFYPHCTKLESTLSTEPREVLATIDHCGYDGKIELNYSFDKGTTFAQSQMIIIDSTDYSRTFKGSIPGAQPGTQVYYYISSTDTLGNKEDGSIASYYIFKPENPSLLVFNGYSTITNYPSSYYFGYNGATSNATEIIKFSKDAWAYGPLSKELVDHYTNIFEITTTGPKAINNDIIKEWLAASPTHNYLLAGDEYLGTITNWNDTTYAPGDFQYDVLGIIKDHNDINFKVPGDEKNASLAAAVAGTELGDSLHLKIIALNEDTLKIDPFYELASPNWMDAFEPVEGTIVDVTAKGINGNTYNVGSHRTLPAGNKIVFLAFDPLSLDSPESNYFWYGFDRVSPLVQAMRWFGADVVDVENESSTPDNFQLNQNYPNPFNPSTVISWQLAVNSKVSLIVYDVLGNEVAVLVNEEKPAGNYKTDFKGNNLASGIYFYTLRAGSFVQSRKMILLK